MDDELDIFFTQEAFTKEEIVNYVIDNKINELQNKKKLLKKTFSRIKPDNETKTKKDYKPLYKINLEETRKYLEIWNELKNTEIIQRILQKIPDRYNKSDIIAVINQEVKTLNNEKYGQKECSIHSICSVTGGRKSKKRRSYKKKSKKSKSRKFRKNVYK